MAANLRKIESLLKNKDKEFWTHLDVLTQGCTSFRDLSALSNFRKKALQQKIPHPNPKGKLKLAIIGGFSLQILSDLIQHRLESYGLCVDLFLGEFDNYHTEILDPNSEFYKFGPNWVFILPSRRVLQIPNYSSANTEQVRNLATIEAKRLVDFCEIIQTNCKAEVLLSNFSLPSLQDPGPYRARNLSSAWSFTKLVNIEIGLRLPSSANLCDLEFLSAKKGLDFCDDKKTWLESKQPFHFDFMGIFSNEIFHQISYSYRIPKKVLVLDLDNTLWGGVIGDDGISGIELGTISSRGEAFLEFQKFILALSKRGILLAVCSKNEEAAAVEPFKEHSEMVLKLNQFASFKANWNPKPDNIRAIAEELKLGLNSFVFVDDNPAEIEIVNQFLPEVSAICLGDDPSEFIDRVAEKRFFEVQSLTDEDLQRSSQYQQEIMRKQTESSFSDIGQYLISLEMSAEISDLSDSNIVRVAQLINKSNQFNLTTIRRSEVELRALTSDPAFSCFSVRLSDKFGDHGLICVVILKQNVHELEIDTWLMSCRVLSRDVEKLVVNEIVERAKQIGVKIITGKYIRTAKNNLVKNLLENFGFSLVKESEDEKLYKLSVPTFTLFSPKIKTIIKSANQ